MRCWPSWTSPALKRRWLGAAVSVASRDWRRVRRSQKADESRPAQPFRLVPATQGSLDRFDLEPMVRLAPGPGEVEIAVEATGLNFKDVLNVLGMYPGDPGPLGGECAGRVSAVGAGVTHVRPGDDVLAVAGGSFASHVIARAEFVQPRPAGMSAEEGASFPIAFLTAEFCLGHLATVKAGERVLIHAAAGGVGMAAVRLAQRAGADVFATAGSPSKRELLRAMGVEHVFDSRSIGVRRRDHVGHRWPRRRRGAQFAVRRAHRRELPRRSRAAVDSSRSASAASRRRSGSSRWTGT